MSLFCLWLLAPVSAWALGPFYLTGTLGHEAIQGYPVAEGSLFFGGYGLRGTKLLGQTAFTDRPGGSATEPSRFRLEGDPQFFSVLKALDRRDYPPKQGLPFDFMTAYFGLGYSNSPLTLTQRQYGISGGQVVLSESTEEVSTQQWMGQFGFLAGQSVAAIDLKLFYLIGQSRPGHLLNEAQRYYAWGMLFSVGVGF
ncbi:MAG: hypothetical protein RRB13_00070 [bacterium]|nr:hypothetical protein [bacterium]